MAAKKGEVRKKKPRMTGAVAAGPHEGSRSEIIADYLFASWGTVTPVRRQDDHGLDLYCTLTERIGKRAIVTDYYVVQVKSTLDPLKMETPESVQWLVENPSPFFLTCVDKKEGVLRVYQLMTRFHVAINRLPPSLSITLEDSSEGSCPSLLDKPDQLSATGPILRIEWSDILDDEKMDGYREVLTDWVRIDRMNLDRRASGILRYQMPVIYKTNERPKPIHREAGNPTPDNAQMARALEKLADTLDCVGHQLLSQRKDRKAAFLAAALLRHTRTRHASELPPRWQPTADTSLEREVRHLFDHELQPDDPRWTDLLTSLDRAMAADPHIATYLAQT
jgi:hypothetical protein